jgi:hypothetical protein
MDKTILTPYESLFVGIIGGTSETIIQMPLITYKLYKQNGISLPKSINKWYRGVLIQSINVAPITAFQMMSNNLLTKILIKDNVITYSQKVGIASLAGSFSSLIYTPIDLITIQQQKNNINIKNTISHVYKYNGIYSFFKGIFPCAIRESIYTGGYLGLAPVISNIVQQNLEINKLQSNIYGSLITGTIASLITHPFDTTKTIIQSDLTKNYNTFKTMNEIIKNNGITYLYKGCVPRVFRTCGAFGICISIQDFAYSYKKNYIL